MASLVDAFLAARPAAASRPAPGDQAALEAALRAAHAAGQAAHPGLALAATVFAGHLGALSADHTAETVAGLRAPDLYLVAAVLAEVPGADPAFLHVVDPAARAAVARLMSSADAEDLCQRVREKLLTARAGEKAPYLASYQGRGPLGGWVRTVAAREALSQLRRAARPEAPTDDDAMVERLTATTDPELDAIKVRYRPLFRRAFAEAVQGLHARQRTLLRYHYADGQSLEAMAAVYQVHRATVVRWLHAARQAVLQATKDAVSREVALESDEFVSMVRVLQSQMAVRLEDLLRTPAPPGPEDGTP